MSDGDWLPPQPKFPPWMGYALGICLFIGAVAFVAIRSRRESAAAAAARFCDAVNRQDADEVMRMADRNELSNYSLTDPSAKRLLTEIIMPNLRGAKLKSNTLNKNSPGTITNFQFTLPRGGTYEFSTHVETLQKGAKVHRSFGRLLIAASVAEFGAPAKGDVAWDHELLFLQKYFGRLKAIGMTHWDISGSGDIRSIEDARQELQADAAASANLSKPRP